MKTSCRQCGQHLSYTPGKVAFAGQCPSCTGTVIIPPLRNWLWLRGLLYAAAALVLIVGCNAVLDSQERATLAEYRRGEEARQRALRWDRMAREARTQEDVERLRRLMDAEIEVDREKLCRLQATGR